MGIDINRLGAAGGSRVFVEVSEKPVSSTIVREGKALPVAEVNKSRLEDWLGQIRPVPPPQVQRVVSQSVPAGTVVPKGTTIDLVTAPVRDVPGFIFAGAHADLAQRRVFDVIEADALQDERIQEILTKRERPEDVTEEERRVVLGAMERLDIGVDEQDPNRNYAAGHRTLRNMLAFKG